MYRTKSIQPKTVTTKSVTRRDRYVPIHIISASFRVFRVTIIIIRDESLLRLAGHAAPL